MDDAEPPAPLPPGWADIKDQWRRYGLAEGMRNHSDAIGGRERTTPDPFAELDTPAAPVAPVAPAVPDTDRLTNRVLELERALDVQAAIVRQLVARTDRLEREAAAAPAPERQPAPPDHDETGPTRARLDDTWTWVRGRLARGRS